MKVNRIQQIIALITVSLIGLVITQLYWVDNAIELKEQDFAQNVNKALNATVLKLEKKEQLSMMSEGVVSAYMRDCNLADMDSCLTVGDVYFRGPNNKLVKMVAFPDRNIVDNIFTLDKETMLMLPQNKGLSISVSSKDSIQVRITGKLDSEKITREYVTQIASDPDSSTKQSVVVKELLMDIISSDRSVGERVNLVDIDIILRKELLHHNIPIPFQYAVAEKKSDQSILMGSVGFTAENIPDAHKISLFPGSVLDKGSRYLAVYFPDEKSHVLMSLWVMLSFSTVLILAVVFGFTYTILTMIRQKKLADMKSDFINNLTHEFKTPISSIALATEAIKDETIVKDAKQAKRFHDIIEEENKKLGTHVETVLKIAQLDKDEFKIEHKLVDIHKLIDGCIQNAGLLLDSRNGAVVCDYNAEEAVIPGDEEHIGHIISNLLDNAIKYAVEPPKVTISTSIQDHHLVIKVKDNGIGISRDAQKRVFERFYRVSTGNIHDVKGFGLGLSYVKSMIEAHNGSISVDSELNKGSEFTIRFPIKK